jgi:tetratricopeptide (TPR) repeat protein
MASMRKLNRYCEALMEACWLTALVCTPLFFSVWGEGVASDKNYLLRSLAIVLLAAWGVKGLCHIGGATGASNLKPFSFRRSIRTPLVVPIVLLVLAWIISTALSLSPWDSFWGLAFVRAGTYSSLCCVLFGVAMASNIRSEQQILRAVTVVILTSLPICLYGIGQRFSIEPIEVLDSVEKWRVGSTLGNPIFLAAYLIMVFPLTAGRTIVAWNESKAASATTRSIQQSIYILTALLQLVCIFLTSSRGPVVGLIAGCSIMILLLALSWRKRRLVFGMVGTGSALLAGLLILAFPIGPIHKLANRPSVARFTEILTSDAGGSGRQAIWEKAVQTSTFTKVVTTAEGNADRLASVRFLFGYGPETAPIISRWYRVEGYHDLGITFLTRFHNDFWEALTTTGVFGLGAHLALIISILYFGCHWLGLTGTPNQKWIFWGLITAGTLLGVAALTVWKGLTFFGLGMRLGMVAGLAAFLISKTRQKEFHGLAIKASSGQTIMLIALIGALVAHLTEIAFAFTVETTVLYFWVYLALLLLLGHGPANTTETALPRPDARVASRPEAGSWNAELVVGSLVLALMLASFGFMLLRNNGGISSLQTVITALTRLPGTEKAISLFFPIAAIISVSLFAIIWACEQKPRLPFRPILRSSMLMAALAVILGSVYWLALAKHTRAMILPSGANLSVFERFLRDYTYMIDFHYGFVLIMLLLLACALFKGRRINPVDRSEAGLSIRLAAFALLIAAVALVYLTQMKWAKAGVMENLTGHLIRLKKWPVAAAVGETATKTLPRSASHYLTLGGIYIEWALASNSDDERRTRFLKADRVLEVAHQLNPLDPRFLSERGNLHLKWALVETLPERRTTLGKKAVEHYERAGLLDPYDFQFRNSIAFVQFDLLGQPGQAEKNLMSSLQLHSHAHGTYFLLGDVFSQRASVSPQRSADQMNLLRSAATNYGHAVKFGSNLTDTSLLYLYAVSLGKTHVKLEEPTQAIGAYQIALSVSPPADRWKNEETLARLFSETKNKTNAALHLDQAIQLAPPENRGPLIDFRNRVLPNL